MRHHYHQPDPINTLAIGCMLFPVAIVLLVFFISQLRLWLDDRKQTTHSYYPPPEDAPATSTVVMLGIVNLIVFLLIGISFYNAR